MSIDIKVLGRPGEDNATLIRIDSGSSIHRLLFDCGERCLDRTISVSEIQEIEHLLFSHYHMDHICGFDTFFRHNYNRPHTPINIWGPPGSIDVMQHRFQGFCWNLHHRQWGEWIVNEVRSEELRAAKFLTKEAFAKRHKRKPKPLNEGRGELYKHRCFSISVKALNHGSIPSMAFRVDEPERENVDITKLKELGFTPGPWIRELKESVAADETLEIDGNSVSVAELREKLLIRSKGESVACMTDFILEPGSSEWQDVVSWLEGVDTLVCEAQYLEEDYEYAKSNSHMTAHRVAQLASDAAVNKLVIQHVSRRYTQPEWRRMLKEARQVFNNTHFPEDWRL